MENQNTNFYDRLLAKLREEPGFVGSELESRLVDNDDELADLISEEAESVLSVSWSPEEWGHAGVQNVSLWRNYYFFESSDVDEEGPFDSLEQALEVEHFHVELPNPEISSEVVPLDKLKILALDVLGNNGTKVMINDEVYRRKGNRVVKAKT
jgi:hypothetical protein